MRFLVWLLVGCIISKSAMGLSSSSGGPRSAGRRVAPSGRRRGSSFSRRQPRPESRTPPPRVSESDPFDPVQLTASQQPNEDAPPIDLASADNIQMLPSTPEGASAIASDGLPIETAHFETLSLDDLFPNLNFSHLFATSEDFRQSLRSAIRRDVFDTTPAYAKLSAKVTEMMLDDDSSVQGSWQCQQGRWIERRSGDTSSGIRMRLLTRVLRDTLGPNAPTGDMLMDTIGDLCGDDPSTHFIDIVGVKDRMLNHSWHQDTGRSSPRNTRTVMWGFPPLDEYRGTGVFSHIVKLDREHVAPTGHPPQQPIVFRGTVEEHYIVRPLYQRGRELLIYRDVDVIHSAPDVTYRSSVMRFM